MPESIDKTKVLYDAVSKDYDIGGYDDFKAKLQDPIKRKAFYDGVGSEYNLGDYSNFEYKVGAKKKYTRIERFKIYFQLLAEWWSNRPKFPDKWQ